MTTMKQRIEIVESDTPNCNAQTTFCLVGDYHPHTTRLYAALNLSKQKQKELEEAFKLAYREGFKDGQAEDR